MINEVGSNAPLFHSANELLKFVFENGMLDLTDVEKNKVMIDKEKYLNQHQYSIWQNKQNKWCTYLPKDGHKNNRMLYKRNTKEEIEQLIIDFYRGKDDNPTIKEVWDEYISHRREMKKVSEGTIFRDTARFKRYYNCIQNKRIKDFLPLDIETFLESKIAEYNLTATEFSALKGITRGFLKRAKKRGLIDFDVTQLLQELDVTDAQFRKRIVDDDKEVYYDDEMYAIIRYAKEHPLPVNLGIALMFVTGIRVGELCSLKKEDFVDDLIFKVKRTETRYLDTSTNKFVYRIKDFPKTQAGYRSVIIPSSYKWIVEEINKYNSTYPNSEFMFAFKGDRLKAFSFRRQLYRIDDRFGFEHKSPHKIRKTYCSILLDNNLDNKIITKQVGHVDISVTEQRYHRDRRALEEKIKVFDSIPEFC